MDVEVRSGAWGYVGISGKAGGRVQLCVGDECSWVRLDRETERQREREKK